MVGTQKERGGEMEVEIIKVKGAGEDTSTGRKIDRLRVAAYCRVSTDDEDQIKSYNSMVRYYTDLIRVISNGFLQEFLLIKQLQARKQIKEKNSNY